MRSSRWLWCLIGIAGTLAWSGCLERKLKPLNPCLVSAVVDGIEVNNIEKVDLLFMVDNSNSMQDEQAALRAQFENLIRALTTGDRDNDGTADFPPAKDLHLGVVSSDMGLLNVVDVPQSCRSDFGDDGVLRHTPNPALDCKPSYPPFLSYNADVDDPIQASKDFACIATLGTGGCGIEQQLESALKALWPSVDPMPVMGKNRIEFLDDGTGFGLKGHGDRANAGFLRNDKATGQSLIAIILVTDEEDCSSADTSPFEARPDPNGPFANQDINLRCFYNPDRLYPLERYINGFKALRPGEDLVVFGAIVGVPPDLVTPEAYARVDWDDPVEVDGFYKRILDDTRMQETVDMTAAAGSRNLVTSCQNPGRADSKAYPPRRIVEVARAFGANGTVHSICEDDFGPAIDRIVGILGDKLRSVCLPRPLVRDAFGMVACDVFWELPAPHAAQPGTPTTCGAPGFEFLLPAEEVRAASEGRTVCRVAQMAVVPDATAEGGMATAPTDTDGVTFAEGWFYDDFTSSRSKQCKRGAGSDMLQRVNFTARATPPNGVNVRLSCLNETQSLAQNRTDIDPRTKQPTIGDACGQNGAESRPGSDDEACAVRLLEPSAAWPDGVDRSMFCHPEDRVCVRACRTSADCPPAWVCDDRLETLARAAEPGARDNGSAICVNPTCGTNE